MGMYPIPKSNRVTGSFVLIIQVRGLSHNLLSLALDKMSFLVHHSRYRALRQSIGPSQSQRLGCYLLEICPWYLIVFSDDLSTFVCLCCLPLWCFLRSQSLLWRKQRLYLLGLIFSLEKVYFSFLEFYESWIVCKRRCGTQSKKMIF